jgi:hypothetical protein
VREFRWGGREARLEAWVKDRGAGGYQLEIYEDVEREA